MKYRAIPVDHADQSILDSMQFYSKGKQYDGKFVYGWLVENYIIGPVVEATDEYINFSYWIPIKKETIERLENENTI